MSASRAATHTPSLSKKLQQEWRFVTLFLLALVVVLSFYRTDTGLARLDNMFYDFSLAAGLPQAAPQDIALIAIDDGSINELGYWPWRRSLHARLLENLKGARAIGMDIVFQEHNPAYPHDDEVLATAIIQSGNVVLPLIYLQQENRAAEPLPVLRDAAAGLGYINIEPDADGVVRKVTLQHQLSGNSYIRHFAPTLLQVGEKSATPLTIDGAERYIPYAGRPRHFATYSYLSVLKGHYPPDFFHDKYVLVGAWSSGLGDSFSTPMSKAGQATMSGVEVLANIVLATQRSSWIRVLPAWLTALLSTLPVLLLCLILLRRSPRQAFLYLSFILMGLLALNWLAMHLFLLWMPPTASLLVTALAYPLWHWRSQEAALRQVSLDLEKLQLDYPDIKAAMSDALKQGRAHSLPQRLALLHKSIDLLRLAQTKREETLRFISHDMRAPQNSLLALSALQKQNQFQLSPAELLKRVETYATQTLELVDSFMDLARAEAMDMTLEAINLADLLADSMDHAWAAASSKHTKLIYPEEIEAWIMGNPSMLRRALSNLIENAIKYGPTGNLVSACLTQTQEQVLLCLSDKGWGIAPEHVSTIFEPYHRAHHDLEQAPAGSGLGLAFVKTVILRHGGEIRINSIVGQGSTFTISLPKAPAS